MHLRILVSMRLMEGVGLESPPADGFQSYLSPASFSAFPLSEGSVATLGAT
jgi:hypothetical protein